MSANTLSIMIPCSEVKRESVRRCLFGRPDPLKLSEELKRQNKIFSDEEVNRWRAKWGFDPATGPLESGPYEFIAMDPNEVPGFYTKGYPSFKSKPARLSHQNCYLGSAGVRNRPVSAKRKLDLSEVEQDENISGSCDSPGSIHRCAAVRSIGTRCANVSSLSSLREEIADNASSGSSSSTISRLRGFSLGLTRSSSEPTLLQLSPRTQLADNMTPPSKPRVTYQSYITDYMPHKKQRVTTKPSPQT